MARRHIVPLAALAAALLAVGSTASAQTGDRSARALPASVADLRLDTPVTGTVSTLDPTLADASGDQTVIVRLVGDAVAEAPLTSKEAKKAHKRQVEVEQRDFLSRVQQIAPSARLLAETQTVLNAVFLEVDASELDALAADRAVLRISGVKNYELDLSETVPYIGATAVQADGFDGSGVTVAVLDSGVDYTHAALGGGGTLADYAAAYGAGPGDPLQTTRDGLFPTAKVVEGFDFVGEAWPGGPLAPDPDPIDFEGHGTHVADIIGGAAGVAPGADILAVKVCSAVSSSCSGIALIQGMDYAVDPDGDGDPSDAVDVINMSLGSDYGQSFDDDLSVAVDNASALGVLTVASAGNAADKPFIVGTPSAAMSALSVAQTQVPSAGLQFIEVGGTDYPAVFQPWSVPVGSTISGPVQYGDGAGGNLNGCAPFAPGSLTGLVVLVDRGACNFTLKIKTIGDAGGVLGIIGLVAPGAPFSGGDGGDPTTIPGFMISQADSNAIKGQLGSIATIDPANSLPLVGQMVGSSSRGPNYQNFIVKPEIGAPGASVSAIAGSGSATGAFGGTSGAAPMVAGSAALLLQAEPGLTPAESKARLVNTGETDIDTDPFAGLAPISRIGGGEVRVDRAVGTKLAAWDRSNLLPTLSFGHIEVSDDKEKIKKKVEVHNYGTSDIRLTATPTFRFADDAASGAVEVKIKGGTNLKVKAGQSKTFEVELTIRGELLPGNFMNSGSQGADGASLTLNEFDGYIEISDGGSTSVHVPWHVLPRRAAEVKTDKYLRFRNGTDTVKLQNKGVGTAQIDSFSLIGVSPNLPEGTLGAQAPVPDLKAFGVNTFPVPAGFCSGDASFLWSFGINTWERQTMAVAPGFFNIDLDTNQDGIADYAVFNWDLSSPLSTISDGRNVVWTFAYDATGTFLTSGTAFFFTEQATVTGNTNMLICGEQIGLTGTDLLSTNVDVLSVSVIDLYFTGLETDSMGPFTITPGGEQYVGAPVDVAGNSRDSMVVTDFGPFPGNSEELGVMLFTNGDRGAGARGGATEQTEALFIPTKDARRHVKDVIGN